MAKHAEGREKTERLVIPVTPEEFAFAKNAVGESGFAGRAREVLRAAGLLPPLQKAEPATMPVGLKVWGWTGSRHDPRNTNHHGQTREIVAAPSKAAAVRAIVAAGDRPPGKGFGPTETGNDGEIAQATTEPGVIFWRPLGYGTAERVWYADEDERAAKAKKGAR